MVKKRARVTSLICYQILEKKMGKYLVLGSNSFSGSNFCSWLVSHGHHVLLPVDRVRRLTSFCLSLENANPENFTFAKIDLNHDIGELKKIVHFSTSIHRKFCCSIDGCSKLALPPTLGGDKCSCCNKSH